MIDVHAHLFFDELLDQAGDFGPSIVPAGDDNELRIGGYTWPMGKKTSLAVSSEQRIQAMDEAEIDIQVVSISPLWLFHHAPARVATEFAKHSNDLVRAWCAADDDRLLGLASLPTQDIDAAVRELDRSVGAGLKGAYIGTDASTALDDPRLGPLYARCAELDVPLFIHSTVPGVDGPPGDPRLDRWLNPVILGYPFEETLAVTTLILGGVLTRHPKLDICLPHGGGAAPFLHGRLRQYCELGTSPIDVAEFDRAFGALWFDTHVHSDASLQLLRQVADSRRLVFGSNFGGWDAEPAQHSAELARQLVDNARALLRL